MSTWDVFYGPNAGYAQELYERFLGDPESVDSESRTFFQSLGNGASTLLAESAALPPVETPVPGTNALLRKGENGATAVPLARDIVGKIVAAARLARSIREYGHLAARIDPLGGPCPGDPMLEPETHHITDGDLAELPASIVWPAAGTEIGSCLDAIEMLREIYSGPLGYEFDHVQDYDERAWLHEKVETGVFRVPLPAGAQRDLLMRLTEVETLEKFLHTVFVGQKRFSIEGTDALVPMLDELIRGALGFGTREVVIGMSHRGRLNVLAHILEKPYERIFSEFHAASSSEQPGEPGDAPGMDHGWTGDVKYHHGARKTVARDQTTSVQITLADNPSHLEYVNPTVQGSARAAQEGRERPGAPEQDVDWALAVTIHGDAAFPGEGVVAETLNLSGLAGYSIGGTVRIITNNQVGFTTDPSSGRSTLYASDLAKGFEIPVVHVNADDPEACLTAIKLAHAYRQRFHKDFLIDLVGYRRWGHNEGDEPGFTQPVLYGSITGHETVRSLYSKVLLERGTISEQDAEAMRTGAQARLQSARERLTSGQVHQDEPRVNERLELSSIQTAVPAERLRAINAALLERPQDFTANQKLERILARRTDALDRPGGIDWGLAETLAFGSILSDGTPIRLTGQDSERGTFGQRNLVLHDSLTGSSYAPLQHLASARASFAIYNSPLTEAAVVGFEYGYSVHAPETLVIWEAQYGDFANAAQVLIDQFLASARAKWRQEPSLVLLLPHGYEGQGPEHSSARLERYLQLAAEDNMRIANCTSAAQYFHLLRLHAATLTRERRPLIVVTPKSLLRLPRAASSLEDLTEGTFRPVLLDTFGEAQAIERVVLCSGRVGIDVLAAAEKRGAVSGRTAVVRLEMLYPFPLTELRQVFSRLPSLRTVCWTQEEPRNMGAWAFVAPRLRELLPDLTCLTYSGRPERASTAEGNQDVHAREQARIIEEALGNLSPVGGRGGEHAV